MIMEIMAIMGMNMMMKTRKRLATNVHFLQLWKLYTSKGVILIRYGMKLKIWSWRLS